VAVDLLNLVDPLRREVNPPGSDLFPESTDDNWAGSLADAFWEIRLYGLLSGFEENAAARGGPASFGEGIVTPLSVAEDYDSPSGYASVDLGRELQQLVVSWAAYKIVLARMGSLSTSFRARAGPVEYETQNAATVLKTILDQLKARLDYILNKLVYGSGSSVELMDAVIERTYNQAVGDVWWVR
jgi:hypothetical protein